MRIAQLCSLQILRSRTSLCIRSSTRKTKQRQLSKRRKKKQRRSLKPQSKKLLRTLSRLTGGSIRLTFQFSFSVSYLFFLFCFSFLSDLPSTPQPAAPDANRRQQMVDHALKQNDQMLNELSGVVGDLKSMALEMSVTTARHNRKLDDISDNVSRANVRLKKDTARIEKRL